jgi:hypothetical protein
MNHAIEPALTARPLPPPGQWQLQPDDRAGLTYERAERRRPHDRRQQRYPVRFDMPTGMNERRRQRRRTVYDPSHRRWPEPPQGIDVWT